MLLFNGLDSVSLSFHIFEVPILLSKCAQQHACTLRPFSQEGKINLRVIPCARMKTLPLRLSFPFDSTDLPRLKIDFHFFDFPENFLLTNKRQLGSPAWVNCKVLSAVLNLQGLKNLLVWYVYHSMIERGAAGIRQTVLTLTFFMQRVVWAQGASLGLF